MGKPRLFKFDNTKRRSMLEIFFYAFLFAALGYVHVNILCDDDMIFGKLPNFTIEHGWPIWLRKITWACEYCVAGQVAFWSYPFLFKYNLFEHFGFIALTILFVEGIVALKMLRWH